MPNNYISHHYIENSRIDLKGIILQVPSNQIKIKLKLHLLLFYPSTWYICDFFLFHIRIEGKCGWIIGEGGGGGGGAKGMMAPLSNYWGPAPPPPPPPGPPLPMPMQFPYEPASHHNCKYLSTETIDSFSFADAHKKYYLTLLVFLGRQILCTVLDRSTAKCRCSRP